jgi:hypothetical protein
MSSTGITSGATFAEIARHWEYADPGHFGKGFRTAYGDSAGGRR